MRPRTKQKIAKQTKNAEIYITAHKKKGGRKDEALYA